MRMPRRPPTDCSRGRSKGASMRSIPSLKEDLDRLAVIPGSVPDPFNLPAGCRFHPRCPYAIAGTCDVIDPPEVEASPEHLARCVLVKPQA